MASSSHDAEQAGYFDEWSRRVDPMEIADEHSFEFRFFKKTIGIDKKAKILDVGCGFGRYAISLLKAGHDVFGMDISTESLERLQKAYMDNRTDSWGTLKVGSTMPNDSFDYVICVNLLHHVDAVDLLFSDMAKAVGEGGSIVIFDENPANPAFRIYFSLNGTWHIEKGVEKIPASRIESLLHKHGFESVRRTPYTLFPSRLCFGSEGLMKLNVALGGLPLMSHFSLFNIYSGRKP